MTTLPEIVTQGTGTVERLGDQAEVSVEFAAVAKTRTEAVTALGRSLRAFDTPIIAAQTVRSRKLMVLPQYRHDDAKRPEVVGCRALQTVQLLVPDLAQLEELIGALVAAEPASIEGPRWVLSDATAMRREAQQRAVLDAKGRAEGYADALGGRIGALLQLSDQRNHAQGLAGHGFAMAAGSQDSPGAPDIRELQLDPEPVSVTASCTTTWELVR